MTYSVGIYRDAATGRNRIAVYDSGARVWYFARRYGNRAAQSLAARLNRGE